MKITLWHPATEPVSAEELYQYLTGTEFNNVLGGTPVTYNYKTVYDKEFGGKDGYICTKEEVLISIKEFVDENSK